MNKAKAKEIAKTITNKELQEMFEMAKNNITNWKNISCVNKGMTKGTSWNILAKNFDISENYHILAKTNMIREFGEFLSMELNGKKSSKTSLTLIHQEPQF